MRTWRGIVRRVLPLLTHSMLAVFLLSALACGGSNGGGPAPPGACLELTSTTAPSAGTVVLREGAASTCDRLALELVVTGVSDIFAVEFTITFDDGLVGFSNLSTTGSILSSDGTGLFEVHDDRTAGEVQVAITRLGAAAGGIDAVGPSLLATLYFQRVADTGTGPAMIVGGTIRDSQAPPEVIPGLQWFGATLVIR